MNEPEQGEPELAAPVPAVPRTEARHPSLLELVTNPRGFFEALEAQPVSFRVPALIVFAVGLIAAVAAYQVSSVLMNAMDIPGVEGFGAVMGAIGAISGLIATFLFWVIYTAAFYAISMAFNGRGDFNRLLAYVGYGHLPQLIGGVVSLILTWSYLSDLRVPRLSDPQAIQQWTETLMQDPSMRLSIVVSLLFLLWSANIWIFGVRTGRKISTRDAAISVLVPILAYVLIFIVPSLVA